jgi:hypothetical protein
LLRADAAAIHLKKMSTLNENSLGSKEQQELAAAWKDVVEKSWDKQTQALIGGLNFRFNVGKAFKAAWTTAKIYLVAKTAIVTGAITPAVLGLPADIWTVIVATLDALREKMLPLEYTACVVLSSSPDGMTEQEFQQQLRDFLVSGKGAELPWYLGLTASRRNDSLLALEAPDGFTDLMKLLRRNDWLIEDGGKVKFKPRHYTWGVSVA